MGNYPEHKGKIQAPSVSVKNESLEPQGRLPPQVIHV